MSVSGMPGPNPDHGIKWGQPTVRQMLAATAFVLASFALINLCWVWMGTPSTFAILAKWSRADAAYDSWSSMRHAFEWLRNTDVGLLYQEIFFNRHLKFQYPPSSLLPLLVFEKLGMDPNTSPLNAINALIHLGGALAAGVASVVMLRRSRDHLEMNQVVWATLFGLTVFVTLYPTMRAYELGQIQVWINAAFCLAGICWMVDRKWLVGALIGGICLIKPQFALFLIWALVRREWGFMAGWAAVMIPGLAISVIAFGFANHWDYLTVLQYMSQRGEAFITNQSINGLLNRFLGNGNSQVFEFHEFPPYNPVVYIGTLLTSLALLAFVLFYRPQKGFFDFLMAGLGFTIASPIAWEHHYGILPIYFIALFFVIVSRPPATGRTALLVLLAAALVMTENFFFLLKPIGPGFASVVQSYLLFAAIAILWLLYKLRDDVPWEGESAARSAIAPGGRVPHGL